MKYYNSNSSLTPFTIIKIFSTLSRNLHISLSTISLILSAFSTESEACNIVILTYQWNRQGICLRIVITNCTNITISWTSTSQYLSNLRNNSKSFKYNCYNGTSKIPDISLPNPLPCSMNSLRNIFSSCNYTFFAFSCLNQICFFPS